MLHGDNQPLVLRHKREHRKTRGVTENAEHHRRAPAELFQSDAENGHRGDFRNLSNAHHRHDPVARNSDRFAAKEHARPAKEAIVHERINERYQPEHQDERVLEQTACFEPREFVLGRNRFLRRRVRQKEAERREQQRSAAGDNISVTSRILQRRSTQSIAQHCADPVYHTRRVGRVHLIPIDENERERPRRENPTDRSTHAHDAKFLFRILHVRERNRVGDRNRRHVKQAVHEHQEKEHPKIVRERQSDHRHAADQMAERQKFLRRKSAIGKLITEEHSDDGRDRERVQNHRLLPRRETEAWQITENQRQPRTPDEKLENHHEEQFEVGSSIHTWRERYEKKAGGSKPAMAKPTLLLRNDVEQRISTPINIVKMPPFGWQTFKAILNHHTFEQVTIHERVRGSVGAVAVGGFGEGIEWTWHLNFSPVSVDEGQIHGGAAVVARTSLRIGDVAGMRINLPHLPLHRERPIPIIHFQTKPHRSQFRFHSCQLLSRGTAQKTFRRGIELLSGEVVRRCVTDIDSNTRHRVFNIHQVWIRTLRHLATN